MRKATVRKEPASPNGGRGSGIQRHTPCRVGIEPSRLAEPSEPAELTRAEPKISESRAERARVLARSPVFCNIPFAAISHEMVHLYVTKFHIYNFKIIQ
jgi:hypothetical protein